MGERISPYDRMTVTVPEGSVGKYHVRRFTVSRDQGRLASMRMAAMGRGVSPGTYTKLVAGDPDDSFSRLWMSDTPDEKGDHYEAVSMMEKLKAERVLINGLGLGMVLSAALSFDHVKHVDVVEISKEIIELVGPHYLRDPRVTIHHADAYEQAKRWPTGTRWDVGWSDIWGDSSTDDLKEHAILNRSYGRRCTWHACWWHDLLLSRKRREQREDARYANFFG